MLHSRTMIVCLCHRVSDRDIVRAVREGTQCFEMLQDETAVASGCGNCHECARDIFDSACADHCGGRIAGQVTIAMPVVTAR